MATNPDPDPIADILADLATDPELTVILSPESIASFGGGPARLADMLNYGSLSARGEWITFTDDNGRDWQVEW